MTDTRPNFEGLVPDWLRPKSARIFLEFARSDGGHRIP